jgi:hypothetical protein
MARASSKRSGTDRETAQVALTVWIVLLLAVPRIVRLLYPQVWIEDDFYLEDAYLVSIGMRPYLDFVHPHMPLLEWFTAGYLRLFGASLFSVEVLNQIAIYATSVMTCALAHKAAGRRTAICAAILYAFAALVFRYHVYERESFIGVAVAAAALIALREDLDWMRQGAIQAALFVVACAIKLTAIVPAAAILCFLALGRRRWRDAILAAAGIAAGLAAFSAILYRWYGFEFVFQTFIFHFVKGRLAWLDVADYPRAILDLLAPLFVIGCVRVAAERRVSLALGLVLILVAFNYAFFGLLSPTSWGHNYLDFLPYVAIVAAIGLDRIWTAYRTSEWRITGASLGLIAVSLLWLTPLVNENWMRGGVYGFGYIDRAEVDALSEALRRISAPDDEVIAPSVICFEANRRQLIRYPETYGVYREAEDEFRKYGFFEARQRLGSADFFGLIASTAHYWKEPMNKALDDGTVNAIIPDSPMQLSPMVSFSSGTLMDHGFRPYLVTENFALWRRVSGAGQPQGH